MGCPTLPPGPRLPAAIQSAWLAYRPYRFLERCRDAHVDAFTIATPLGRTPIFAHPDHVERIFELDGRELLGGAAQSRLFHFAGDRSLMKLDGPTHREHRARLVSALSPSELPGGGARLLETVRRAVAAWPVGRRFSLGDALDRLAVDLVAEVCLDGAPGPIVEATRRAMLAVGRASTPIGIALGRLGIGGGPGLIGRTRRLVEDHLRGRIDRETPAPDGRGGCIFHRLMPRGTGCPRGLDPEDVRDETMTVMAAMLGGLSCSMKHSFSWIARTPGVQERIRVAPASGPSAIAADPYLDAVCKEVLRLCPDIPFAVRQAASEVAIGPWTLPAGTMLGIGIHLIHQRPTSFPKPGRFLPGRFLGRRPSRFEYLPFGGGRRGCVAGSLFPFMQKMILASAFERFRVRLLDDREGPVTSFAIVSTPARPLWAIVEDRATRGVVPRDLRSVA